MSDNDVKIKVSLDGADSAEKGLRGVGNGAEDADGKLGKLVSGGLKGVAVGAAALFTGAVIAGKGLFDLAKGAAEAGDRIDEQSNKLGISMGAYQEWDYVLSQTGASIESLKGGMTRLNTSVDDAINGGQGAIDKFARLGITVDDLAGKSREDIFSMTIAGLQGVTDGGERAAIATELLGRGASELGGLLSTTAADTEAMKQKAIELGLILSDEAVAAGDAFNDSLDTLDRTMTGVKNTIGAQLLPGLTEITLGLADMLAGVDGADERIQAGAEQLVESVTTVLPRILDVFSTILGGVAIIAPEIINSLVSGIVDNLPGLITILSTAVVSLVTLLAAQLPSIIDSGVKAIVALASGISSALPTLIPVIIGGVLGMVQALIGALPLLLGAGLTLVTGLATGILEALPVIIDALPGIIEGIVAFIETGVPMLLDAAITLFMAIIEALPQIIDQLVAVLPGLIIAIITALLNAVPLLIQAGITLLTSLVAALPTIITSIVGVLPMLISSILTAILGAIPLLIQSGIDLFIALVQALPTIIIAIVSAIPVIIKSVLGALTDALPLLIMAGVQLFTAIITNLPTIIFEIIKAVPQIITALVGAFAGSIGELVNVGMNLVRGIWEGIVGAQGWLMDQIAGFVNDVIGGIADFFGIASPSTRLRDEIGAWLPGGIGVGVKENAQDAIGPIDDLNSRIMDEAQKLNTTIAFTHADDFNQQRTLVPAYSATPQQRRYSDEPQFDLSGIGSAISDAFSDFDRSGEREQVDLSRESINELSEAILSGMRSSSRQGPNVLD